MNGALLQQLALAAVSLDADEAIDLDSVDGLIAAALAQGRKCSPDERRQLMDALGRVERALSAAIGRASVELSEVARARRVTGYGDQRQINAGQRVSTRV